MTVSIMLTPKIMKGNKCCIITFVNKSLFFVGAIDSEGSNYVYGGGMLLSYCGSDEFKIKMEAASKELLEMLMNGLKK